MTSSAAAIRGWTDREAEEAGDADGRAWALRTMLAGSDALARYASGAGERRQMAQKMETLMQIVARQNVRRFGAKDNARRESKVHLYVEAYVAGAMEELGREASRRGVEVR
jgi:hypothetical protein